nr:millepattes peptide 1 [Oncopeltus fasciatus]
MSGDTLDPTGLY